MRRVVEFEARPQAFAGAFHVGLIGRTANHSLHTASYSQSKCRAKRRFLEKSAVLTKWTHVRTSEHVAGKAQVTFTAHFLGKSRGGGKTGPVDWQIK